jgi:hypothetical protein
MDDWSDPAGRHAFAEQFFAAKRIGRLLRAEAKFRLVVVILFQNRFL